MKRTIFQVIGPDGRPIEARRYPTEAAAHAALAAWCRRFEAQGYYPAAGERIALADLPARCSIEAL